MKCCSGLCQDKPCIEEMEIEICQPIPDVLFSVGQIPPRYSLSSNLNLNDFPENVPTLTYTNGTRVFGKSEMMIVIIRMQIFKNQSLNISFKNPDGIVFSSGSFVFPAIKGLYQWVYATVGRYTKRSGWSADEITGPGKYEIVISSERTTNKYPVVIL